MVRPIVRLPFVPCLLAASLLVAAHGRAQSEDTDFLVFTLVITGAGSDPDVSEATTRAEQDWRYYRAITGWIEVVAQRKQVGRGSARHEQIEFTRPRDGAFEIAGVRRDWVRNTVRDFGEGGSFADYTAEATFTADAAIDPPDRLQLVLDATAEPSWEVQFVPLEGLGVLANEARYFGSARYEPGQLGGFGEPWTYFTDDATQTHIGERFIEERYHPGRFGVLPLPIEAARRRWPATFDGRVATGHVDLETPRPSNARGTFKMRYVLDWSVQAELTDVELDVRAQGYDGWRPTATAASSDASRGAGAPLYCSAVLRRRDKRGTRPLPKIEQLTWRLVETSREPGVALNWPYASEDERPDLELVAGDLTPARDDENQLLVLRPDGPTSEVAIFPYDWGGFATLRVEALLEDGRVIEGTLLGAPGAQGRVKDIPVPASPPGSHIALAWLRSKCPGWTSDAEDRDARPAGKPGVDGDGFTVYEEYRGFQWNGERVSTDPSRKNLFVRRSPFAWEAERGLARFESLSGLDLHVTEQRLELPGAQHDERVVNVNRGRGASTGPQTALFVAHDPSVVRPNDRIPPGARPATVPVIAVPELSGLGALSSGLRSAAHFNALGELQPVMDHVVVQALFQACGVDRPGPPDPVLHAVLVPSDPATGAAAHYSLDGEPVRIERADGSDYAAFWDRSHTSAVLAAAERGEPAPAAPARDFLVGRVGGAHSGPVECVMRDWFADLYQTPYSRDGLTVYRFTGAAVRGARLGATRRGTGHNASGHQPSPWFGDASVATPAREQLVVRDNAR